MGVPQIPGVQNGDGNPLYTWNYSNKSATLRFGALVALSNLPGASPLDILVFGEVKAPATTPARKMLGVCSLAPAENTLTNFLQPDSDGVTSTPVSSGLGRHKLILSPSQTLSQSAPYLMPDPAIPGNVIAWTEGSGCPPIARALDYPATSVSEQYVEGEFLPASQGLDGIPGDLMIGDATDAVVSLRFIARAGVHVNPGAANETPVLYVSKGRNFITALSAQVSVPPGAGNGVRYEFKVGSTAAAANGAVASSAVDILDTAITSTLVTGQPSGFWMTDGQVLVCKTVAQAGGVGAAVHSTVSFRAQ